MTTFEEGRHPGEFLLSEANFHRSRGKATIAAGAGVVAPGTVLGAITASGKMIPSGNAEVVGSEGAETGVAIALYGCDATDADQEIAIIERDAEVNGHILTLDDTVNDDTKRAAKVAQLADAGIIVRY
ncbi:head decoration protein [Pararhizobium haloflavum]|uniref:head decoration protein n=1 Tax=Pararhizobium haloflavum TaxID=2037914 RepID=UPI000C177E0A|nr:head decoration protein [Pararhizobium haloflavum]